MNIINRKISELKPYPKNARYHSPEQIGQIAESIRQFGFNNPVLIDGAGMIIAGHGRVDGAKIAGMDTVPTICIDHLTDTQKRAYIIADNKLTENASWDYEMLKTELDELLQDCVAMDLMGFNEIDMLEINNNIDKNFENEIIKEREVSEIKTENRCPECGYEW